MPVTVHHALTWIGWLMLVLVLLHEFRWCWKHRACPPAHCECSRLHKFLAGHPPHGHTVTDATYWRPAAKDLTQAKTVGPWLKRPGWQRRLIRTGSVLAVAGLLINWLLATVVLAVLAPFIAAGLSPAARQRLPGVAGWMFRLQCQVTVWIVLLLCAVWDKRAPEHLRTERVVRLWVRAQKRMPSWLRPAAVKRLWRRLRHRDRVQTMGMLLSSITGTSSSSVEKGVSWSPEYTTAEPGDEVARWVLPRGFKATAGEKALAQEVWQSRIGFEVTPSWKLDADEPVMVMKRAYQLPKLVYLHELLEKVEALPEHKTAIGLDDRGELVCWDWNVENPHGLLNAGSRHGKTETEMAMVGQVLRKGGNVTYVDVKRVSIQGLKGLPGLNLLDNPANMIGMWLEIDKWGKDLDDRIDARTKDPTSEFGRDLLVLEEVNEFSERCDEFWEIWPEENEEWKDTILWKPKRAKKTPPIWRVIKKGVWEGAFVRKNVLIAGQNIEAQTVKGVRNSIGMRLMGGYQPQNWKALVGTTPIPPAPPIKGRWCMINGGSQTWVQALIADLTDVKSAAIWRDYARAGRRMDGSLPPVTEPATGPFTVTGNGTIHGPHNGWSASRNGIITLPSVTDAATPMSLLKIVKVFLLPRGTDEEQKKLAQMLRQDRYRSDKGELPNGLEFPEPARVADDGRQTEEFIPSQVIEFNAARRGAVRASLCHRLAVAVMVD